MGPKIRGAKKSGGGGCRLVRRGKKHLGVQHRCIGAQGYGLHERGNYASKNRRNEKTGTGAGFGGLGAAWRAWAGQCHRLQEAGLNLFVDKGHQLGFAQCADLGSG